VEINLLYLYICRRSNIIIFDFISKFDVSMAVILATGWTTEGSEFEFRWGKEFSLLQVVQTDSVIHPTSYLMGTRGSFIGGKAAGAWS
jgi:hypothetical protein